MFIWCCRLRVNVLGRHPSHAEQWDELSNSISLIRDSARVSLECLGA